MPESRWRLAVSDKGQINHLHGLMEKMDIAETDSKAWLLQVKHEGELGAAFWFIRQDLNRIAV